MALTAPYFGRNVDDLIAECDAGYRKHAGSEPCEDLDAFNSRVTGYGTAWCEVQSREFLPGLYVVAGVVGNMSGVPVAQFPCDQVSAAKQYARDFESGKCFVVQNGARWCDYVNAMMECRKVDAGLYQHLISLGRSSGISMATGRTITQCELLQNYIDGKSASEI